MTTLGFHYTSKQSWDELNKEGETFLKPKSRLIRLRGIIDETIPSGLLDFAYDSYLFAFPDNPAPTPWKNYGYCLEEWDTLTGDIGDILIGLKFELTSSDEAYVVDRSYYADWAWNNKLDKAEAIKKYVTSRVLAQNYDGSFRMPELIIKNEIDLERLIVYHVLSRDVVKTDNGWGVEYKELDYSSI